MQSCELSFKKVEKNLCYFLIFCTRSTAALTILAEPNMANLVTTYGRTRTRDTGWSFNHPRDDSLPFLAITV